MNSISLDTWKGIGNAWSDKSGFSRSIVNVGAKNGELTASTVQHRATLADAIWKQSRTSDEKAANNRVRAELVRSLCTDAAIAIKDGDIDANNIISDRILNLLSKLLGSAFARDDFNCGRPLSDRRVYKIIQAYEKSTDDPMWMAERELVECRAFMDLKDDASDNDISDKCLTVAEGCLGGEHASIPQFLSHVADAIAFAKSEGNKWSVAQKAFTILENKGLLSEKSLDNTLEKVENFCKELKEGDFDYGAGYVYAQCVAKKCETEANVKNVSLAASVVSQILKKGRDFYKANGVSESMSHFRMLGYLALQKRLIGYANEGKYENIIGSLSKEGKSLFIPKTQNEKKKIIVEAIKSDLFGGWGIELDKEETAKLCDVSDQLFDATERDEDTNDLEKVYYDKNEYVLHREEKCSNLRKSDGNDELDQFLTVVSKVMKYSSGPRGYIPDMVSKLTAQYSTKGLVDDVKARYLSVMKIGAEEKLTWAERYFFEACLLSVAKQEVDEAAKGIDQELGVEGFLSSMCAKIAKADGDYKKFLTRFACATLDKFCTDDEGVNRIKGFFNSQKENTGFKDTIVNYCKVKLQQNKAKKAITDCIDYWKEKGDGQNKIGQFEFSLSEVAVKGFGHGLGEDEQGEIHRGTFGVRSASEDMTDDEIKTLFKQKLMTDLGRQTSSIKMGDVTYTSPNIRLHKEIGDSKSPASLRDLAEDMKKYFTKNGKVDWVAFRHACYVCAQQTTNCIKTVIGIDGKQFKHHVDEVLPFKQIPNATCTYEIEKNDSGFAVKVHIHVENREDGPQVRLNETDEDGDPVMIPYEDMKFEFDCDFVLKIPSSGYEFEVGGDINFKGEISVIKEKSPEQIEQEPPEEIEQKTLDEAHS